MFNAGIVLEEGIIKKVDFLEDGSQMVIVFIVLMVGLNVKYVTIPLMVKI